MASREDATLLVALAQWGTSLGLQEAMQTVFADDFNPGSATATGWTQLVPPRRWSR